MDRHNLVRRSEEKAQVTEKLLGLGLVRASLRHNFQTYFDNSSLHGVRFIREDKRPFREKFLWFVCTAVGCIATLVIISSLWEKFQTNPTITGLDTDFHNWDVPYPAVYLCPHQFINETLVEDYVQEKHGGDQFYLNFYKTTTSLTIENLANLREIVEENKKEIPNVPLVNLTYQFVKSCEVLINACKFKGSSIDCCQEFKPFLTEIGFCFSYNALLANTQLVDRSRVGFKSPHVSFPTVVVEKSGLLNPTRPRPTSPEEFLYMKAVKAYDVQYFKQGRNFTPQEILETDESLSLFLEFASKIEDLPIPKPLHLSMYLMYYNEVPSIDTQPHAEYDYFINEVYFSEKMTYTTPGTRQLSISQRRCVFPDEIKLKVNSKYTYIFCMIECRMKLSQKLCGCVPHFYPAIAGFVHCNGDKLKCLYENAARLREGSGCDCELGCDNTVYEVERIQSPTMNNPTLKWLTNLEVMFVSWPLIRYKREVLFGWVDLLVSFGGIAGLFMGFSLLSGVEVLYYFTMRALCMARTRQDELRRLDREFRLAPRPVLDLSLTPYFMTSNRDGSGEKGSGRSSGRVGTAGRSRVRPSTAAANAFLPPLRPHAALRAPQAVVEGVGY